MPKLIDYSILILPNQGLLRSWTKLNQKSKICYGFYDVITYSISRETLNLLNQCCRAASKFGELLEIVHENLTAKKKRLGKSFVFSRNVKTRISGKLKYDDMSPIIWKMKGGKAALRHAEMLLRY